MLVGNAGRVADVPNRSICGWDEFGVAVEAHPYDSSQVLLGHTVGVAGFDLLVVVSAEQGPVGEGGFAVVPPRDDVVGVAVPGLGGDAVGGVE